MNKTVMSKVLCHLFSFLTAVSLFALILICTARVTVLSDRYLYRTAQDDGFYDALCSELAEKYAALAPSSGVDADFLRSLAVKDEIKSYVDGALKLWLAGGDDTQFKSDTETLLKDGIYDKLCAYAKDTGYELTVAVKDALLHLADVCSGELYAQAGGNVTETAVRFVGSYMRHMKSLAAFGLAGCALLLAISLGYLLYLCRDSRGKTLKFSAFSACGCGLMLLVIPLAVYISRIFSRLGIGSAAVKSLVIGWAGGALTVLAVSGLILIGCFCALAYFAARAE